MVNYQIEWKNTDTYNFNVEFNRIESYNEYVEKWLKNYYNFEFDTLTHKTDWTINDFVDLKDYNRVKKNINVLLTQINQTESKLPIRDTLNQTFDNDSANAIEKVLTLNLKILGENQFLYNITNLTICGNDLKIYGG